ncbi:hypothetical protein AK812_SmicGene19913 [Symbiodinium microadriaticum]|uniref:Uncharacterized protein n=1 Tax=Symbiodinium microadriaticum TaxID=2951 RepID=A0A1Q9DRC0_SYMMI|nr:hypothetical protein AK812_SmicGene19913 [Symbiodinium microadriaticum]
MATQAPAVHFAPSRGPGRGQAGENCARSPDNPRKTRPCLPLPTQSISGRHLTLGVRVTAIAVEPCSEEDLTWNSEYFKRTGRLLGSVDTSRLKALSLADNHTNCVLRCLLQQVAHTRDETLCHNGRLSLELLSKRDQGLHKAVINGVPWKFTSKDVALQLPHHLSLVQRMGNATLQRAEHELQFMRRLRQLWISHSHGESQPDFAMMKKKTTTGKTVHSKVPPFLYQFALKAAGGRDPSLLNKTESFVRLHSPSTRSLGREFWEKVVAEGAKGGRQHHEHVALPSGQELLRFVSERLKDEDNDESQQSDKTQKKTKKINKFKATQRHELYAAHSIQIDLPGETEDGNKVQCEQNLKDAVVKHMQTGFKAV